MSETDIFRLQNATSISDRTISVTLPAKTVYDLEKIQDIQASILDRLGCPACCSGFDIRFDVTRSFLVDDNLNIREIAGGGIVTDG